MGKRFTDSEKDNKENAIKLLAQFTHEKLQDDINSLKTYSFWEIDGNKDFGNGKSYSDADCTKIVYAVNFLLYGKEIKKITGKNFRLYGYTTKDALYSGETLNTFNTLFSSDSKRRVEIAELYGVDEYKREVFNFSDKDNFNDETFYNLYQRIGNLTFLPCLTIDGESINTWKGCSSLTRDYLFKFLCLLEKSFALKEEPDMKDDCWELWNLKKRNSFFFDSIDSFDKYVKFFDLDDWKFLELDDYLKSSELTKDNIQVAKTYVEKSTTFINNRSEKIVNKLKEILKDNPDFPQEYLI